MAACALSGSAMSVFTNATSPSPAELGRGARALLLADVGDHHLGALGQEPPRVRGADPTPPAGDDRHLVLQSHRFPSSR